MDRATEIEMAQIFAVRADSVERLIKESVRLKEKMRDFLKYAAEKGELGDYRYNATSTKEEDLYGKKATLTSARITVEEFRANAKRGEDRKDILCVEIERDNEGGLKFSLKERFTRADSPGITTWLYQEVAAAEEADEIFKAFANKILDRAGFDHKCVAAIDAPKLKSS